MELNQKVKAGKGLQHTFTLEEAYQDYIEEIRQTTGQVADAAIAAGKLKAENRADAIAQAIASVEIPEEFFEAFPGKFTVHRPSVGETIEIDNDAAKLAAHIPEDKQKIRGGNLATMTATLRKVVDEAPDWYPKDPADLYSSDVISLMHYGWSKFLDSFRF